MKGVFFLPQAQSISCHKKYLFKIHTIGWQYFSDNKNIVSEKLKSRQYHTIETAAIIQLSRLSLVFLHIYQAGLKIMHNPSFFALCRKKKGLKPI